MRALSIKILLVTLALFLTAHDMYRILFTEIAAKGPLPFFLPISIIGFVALMECTEQLYRRLDRTQRVRLLRDVKRRSCHNVWPRKALDLDNIG